MSTSAPLHLSGNFLSCSKMRLLLLLFAGYAWIATPILLIRSIRPIGALYELAIGAVAVAVLLILVLLLRRPRWFEPTIRWPSDRLFLPASIGAGCLLRIIWCFASNASPASDGATYLSLATQMLSGLGYGTAGAAAFWPPGYPLFLVPFLAIMPATLAIPLTQIGLFVVAALGVYRLTTLLASPDAAKYAVALFALWPNLVTLCATPEKEMLVMTLLVWGIYMLLREKPAHLLLSGLLLGCACLSQPSVQLLVPAACVLLVILHRRQGMVLALLVLAGAAIAIGPWTARNYAHFGTFKLISTNGGDVLYRANNPLATGAYTARGEQDLSALPELEFDAASKALAVDWIKQHPRRFTELIVEKQMLFMGDDAYGVYATFRKASDSRNPYPYLYAAEKLAANVWWMGAWLLIAVLIARGRALGPAAVLVWGWLYLFAMHSVFESTGKYHVPMLWTICIVLAVLLASPTLPSRRPLRAATGQVTGAQAQ